MTTDPISVLLIEDNPGDATLIRRLLLGNSQGLINVECASTLSQGKEMLAEGGVDLILLDLTLPDSQGLETFTRVYQQSPDTPIILLTGIEDEELAIQAAHQGAQDYLAKGQLLDIRLLMRSIRYAMERSRLKTESERINNVREQAELKNAVLEERNRIARELHDSLTQSLYSLTLWAEAGRRVVAEGATDLAEEYFGQVGELAQQSLKEMRLLVHELRPLDLDTHGFIGGIQQRLDAVESRAGVRALLQVEGEFNLPIEMQEGLYRVVQESLNNALRHAGADSVTVTIVSARDCIELRVSDDGKGFDPSAAVGSGGMGLTGMGERVKRMGGTLIIDSSPGMGTTILVQLSVSKSVD
jgi:signal transduction histidine kinase